MDVERLKETDLCPCGSTKQFKDCHIPAPIPGVSPELILHLVFSTTQGPTIVGAEAKSVYAVQSLKMNGEVPPDDIVRNIKSRIDSPPIQRTIAKLVFQPLGVKVAEVRPRTPRRYMALPGERTCFKDAPQAEGSPCRCCSDSGLHIIEDPPVEEYCDCVFGDKLRVKDGAEKRTFIIDVNADRSVESDIIADNKRQEALAVDAAWVRENGKGKVTLE